MGIYGLAVVLMMLLVLLGWQLLAVVRPGQLVTGVEPSDLGWEYETVGVTTEDGLELAGWFIPAENEAEEVVLILHGYPADKANVLGMGVPLHNDFDLLLIDFRYFGESEGWMSTLGVNEVRDARAAIEYLDSKGYEKIGVYGFSVGGAVALMEAAENEKVDAVVSQAAYASLEEMALASFDKLGLMNEPMVEGLFGLAKLGLGVDPRAKTPLSLIKEIDIPVLLLHSKQDEVVGFEQAVKLQGAALGKTNIETWFYEGGGHAVGETKLLVEIEDKVYEFFMEKLKVRND